MLHGGKQQDQREISIKGFRDDTFNILIATDVAGRGIDVPDVALVRAWAAAAPSLLCATSFLLPCPPPPLTALAGLPLLAPLHAEPVAPP